MPFFLIPFIIIAAIAGINVFSEADFDFSVPALEGLNLQLPPIGPPRPSGGKGESARTTTPSVVRQAPAQPSQPQQQDEEEPKEESRFSPWVGHVTISSVKRTDPLEIRLSTSLDQNQTVSITGWVLDGQEDELVIPGGVRFWEKTLTPADNKNIVLQRGDKVFISEGLNPLSRGVNFRPNECLAYFDYSISCPESRTPLQAVAHLNPTCQEFVRDLPRCVSQPLGIIDNPTIGADLQCREYLKESRPTYESCVDRHHNERGFLRAEWRVYTDGEEFFRTTHDRIVLKDENGKIVDEFVY